MSLLLANWYDEAGDQEQAARYRHKAEHTHYLKLLNDQWQTLAKELFDALPEDVQDVVFSWTFGSESA